VRVAALADLHGRLDGVIVPPCDLVVIAGDLAPYAWKQAPSQVPWLHAVFAPWLELVAADAGAPVVGIAGNRDFAWWWDRRIFEQLPWTFLNDSEATLAGARVYGSPWCPRRRARPKADEPQPPSPPLPEGAVVPHWPPRGRGGVFMADGEDDLEQRFAAIPEGIDILVTHTPPLGHGDLTAIGEHVGSSALVDAIARTQPVLSLFGHIHEGRGEPTRAGGTLCANSAICDRVFERRNQPWLIDIDLATRSATVVDSQS
jgi:3',5'-cyclic AMP phosphodiesterase CpdA